MRVLSVIAASIASRSWTSPSLSGTRHRRRAEHLRDHRIDHERRPREDDLVARPQHRLRDEPQQLVAPAADDDVLEGKVEMLGQCAPERATRSVGVAVELGKDRFHRANREREGTRRVLVARELADSIAPAALADLAPPEPRCVGNHRLQLGAYERVPRPPRHDLRSRIALTIARFASVRSYRATKVAEDCRRSRA